MKKKIFGETAKSNILVSNVHQVNALPSPANQKGLLSLITFLTEFLPLKCQIQPTSSGLISVFSDKHIVYFK